MHGIAEGEQETPDPSPLDSSSATFLSEIRFVFDSFFLFSLSVHQQTHKLILVNGQIQITSFLKKN